MKKINYSLLVGIMAFFSCQKEQSSPMLSASQESQSESSTISTSQISTAAPVQWNVNGHYYQPISVPGGITWIKANKAAKAAGGYLATTTSDAENNFVFSLIDAAVYWKVDIYSTSIGPWLGGYQPKGNICVNAPWKWVTKEPFVYTNWSPGEPNNYEPGENYMHYFYPGLNQRSNRWNDYSITRQDQPVAYIIEYDTHPLTN